MQANDLNGHAGTSSSRFSGPMTKSSANGHGNQIHDDNTTKESTMALEPFVHQVRRQKIKLFK